MDEIFDQSARAGWSMSGKPNKPRIPALVRHEVENKELRNQAEEDSRMSYRGYEKSKLHSSRKAARKMQREQKKRHKQEHQHNRTASAEKLRKIEEENRILKLKLEKQNRNMGGSQKKETIHDQEPKQKKQKRDEEDVQSKPKRLKVLQFNKDYSPDNSKPVAKNADSIKDQERLEALRRGIEEDERLIQELQGKLGQGWRKELEEDVSNRHACPFPVLTAAPAGARRLFRLARQSRGRLGSGRLR